MSEPLQHRPMQEPHHTSVSVSRKQGASDAFCDNPYTIIFTNAKMVTFRSSFRNTNQYNLAKEINFLNTVEYNI